MNNANTAQNNDHQLIGIANHLLSLFKITTEYRAPQRTEDSIRRNLAILRTTLSGTLRGNLVERLKNTFDTILMTIIDGFTFAGNQHQQAVAFKPFVQETFNSVVDFTVDIESRLLLDKKQDLLGDIHTQLTNAITSQMLIVKLVPTFKFKSRFILNEMIKRQDPTYVSQTDTHPMKDRDKKHEAEMNQFSKILNGVADQFNIEVPVILQMLCRKRERNDNKHYDNRIQAHIDTHQGRAKEFQSFITSQGLLRAFVPTEIDQTQGMYVNHCQFSAIDWHKRYRPGEHIWVYSSDDNRDVAVYIRPESETTHRVWHYNNYKGGRIKHPVTKLKKLSV